MSGHTHTQYAPTSHTHSASQITSGTLPASRGGTGYTSLNSLKSALGISGDTGLNVKFLSVKGNGGDRTISLGVYPKLVIMCIGDNCNLGNSLGLICSICAPGYPLKFVDGTGKNLNRISISGSSITVDSFFNDSRFTYYIAAFY